MARLPTAVPWVLGFTGVGLLVAAIQGKNPLGELRAALTGDESYRSSLGVGLSDPALGAPYSSAASLSAESARLTGQAGQSVTHSPVAGNPGMWLSPAASAAFDQWVRAFGAPIKLTGAGRSLAEQQAGYAKNPGKFLDPEKATSMHVLGQAVDVHTGWLSQLGASGQSRLRVAARATGWGQARYKRGEAGCGRSSSGASTDNDEPWHFSFGSCG